MRIYVLVTSHNPLTIYLYRSGFGRFTHYRYDPSDINNSGIVIYFIYSFTPNKCRYPKIHLKLRRITWRKVPFRQATFIHNQQIRSIKSLIIILSHTITHM